MYEINNYFHFINIIIYNYFQLIITQKLSILRVLSQLFIDANIIRNRIIRKINLIKYPVIFKDAFGIKETWIHDYVFINCMTMPITVLTLLFSRKLAEICIEVNRNCFPLTLSALVRLHAILLRCCVSRIFLCNLVSSVLSFVLTYEFVANSFSLVGATAFRTTSISHRRKYER